MVAKILAPLDGTNVAEAGLTWAEHAAARSGAALRLLSVVGHSIAGQQGLRERAEAYLTDHHARLVAMGLQVDFEVVVDDPADRILKESQEASLTVMTSGTTRWLIGAVLDKVLGHMNRPIVVVRSVDGEPTSPPNLDKILVPLARNGSYSLEILPVTRELAKALDATVVLFHAVPPLGRYHDGGDAPPGVARIIDQALDDARTFLTAAARQVEDDGVAVEVIPVVGEPAKEIIRVANQVDAGLIAMATRGRDSLEKRIVGSIANLVVESTGLPCVLSRPEGAA